MKQFFSIGYVSRCLALSAAALLSACGGGGDLAGVQPQSAAAVAATAVALPEPARAATAQREVLPSIGQGAVPPIPGNVVLNTSFEQVPQTNWALLDTDVPEPAGTLLGNFPELAANTGTRFARLGNANDSFNRLAQSVIIPSGGESAALQFWYQVRTEEADTVSIPVDTLEVSVAGSGALSTPKTVFKLSNLDKTAGWVKSPKIDLRAYKGAAVALSFNSKLDKTAPTRFYIDDVSIVATNPSTIEPETGWWLNAAEPGRGFAIEMQGNKIFIAGFFYEQFGKPEWAVSLLTKKADGSYFGFFDRYTGGNSFNAPFKSATLFVDPPGSLDLSFDSSDSATIRLQKSLQSDSRLIALERFAFAPGKPASNASWQNGWWLNPAEPGSGYFFEAQGNQTFIGAFSYAADGNPTWYVSSGAFGPLQPLVAGPWDQYTGGQTLNGFFKPATKVPTTIANFSANFQSPTTGTLSISNAPAPKPLTRFVFNLLVRHIFKPNSPLAQSIPAAAAMNL